MTEPPDEPASTSTSPSTPEPEPEAVVGTDIEPAPSASEPAPEEDEATRRDREGGQQFGKALVVLGLMGGAVGVFFAPDLYLVAGSVAFVVLGAVVHQWPVEIVRLFTGMGDKL